MYCAMHYFHSQKIEKIVLLMCTYNQCYTNWITFPPIGSMVTITSGAHSVHSTVVCTYTIIHSGI